MFCSVRPSVCQLKVIEHSMSVTKGPLRSASHMVDPLLIQILLCMYKTMIL